jgi:hypothetical protein
MKNYSEITDINQYLDIQIQLKPVGLPNIWAKVNHDYIGYSRLSAPITLDYRIRLSEPFTIIIELHNKDYNANNETAVIIERLSVDNIDIIPKYDYLAEYINDHNNNNPTSYLGFNGKWTLTIDRPFYHWLHKHSGQGWLFG